ncbi:MAG TPA: LLM class flavin-dependent oxidoreductase, partial [Solirubrobacterales bacterium]
DRNGEFEPFGDPADPRERARLLDEGLDELSRYWSEEFKPPPVQQPRIPVWVAGRWPNRRPLHRAARWDGFFPIDLTGADELAVFAEEIRALRQANDNPFDLIIEIPPGGNPQPWETAGATWVLTGATDTPPRLAEVRAVVEAGPR